LIVFKFVLKGEIRGASGVMKGEEICNGSWNGASEYSACGIARRVEGTKRVLTNARLRGPFDKENL